MKKKAVAVPFVLALLVSLVAGIHVVKADIIGNNGMRYASEPYIVFPSNVTYSSKFLTLNVSFSATIGGNINYSMSYSLDGIRHDTVPLVIHYFGFFQGGNYITGSVILPELSEGSHSITVYLECHTHTWNINSPNFPNPDYYTYLNSQTVYFTIGTNSEPSDNWSEVTRFSGSSAHGSNFTTEPFTCNHVDWRIRWEFDSGHGHFPNLHNFSVTTYPQGEDIFYVDSIFETGLGKKSGTSYIHDNGGEFYMKINTGIIAYYTIIVEQDVNSIPEFPSWTPLLIMLLSVTMIAIIYRRKIREPTQGKE